MPIRLPARIAVLLLAALTSAPPLGATAPDPQLETVRQRVRAEFLAPEVDAARIATLVSTLSPQGTWPGIDYGDVSRTGFLHRNHVTNLTEMSRAYVKPGTQWQGNANLKAAIERGIDHWVRHDYIADNWHSNEIANPTEWNRILLLMEDQLDAGRIAQLVRLSGRANIHAWGARPGGDLIKIAGLAAERALYQRDPLALETAVRAMAAEVRVVRGNGLKPDYSFNHRTDRVTSVLSYGTGWASAFADWANRLEGTRFRFPDRAARLVVDYFLEGIVRSQVHGRVPDPGNINREMSRPGTLTPLSPALAERLAAITDHRRDELRRIAEIRAGSRQPDLSGNRFFWHTEYMSHQRPGFFASVRMHSARNNNMEFPHNSESLKHHHYADGANFISRRGDEYTDIYPVWDWQKIPGTTIVQKPSMPGPEEIVKPGKRDFVGGVSDGRYGAAAFDFESPHDPLTARKAWFFFDRELVALGAGIRSASPHPVATTLNQTLLRGPVVARSSAGTAAVKAGDHRLAGAEWVFHDGVAYLFPQPTELRVESRTRTGRWSDFTHQARVRDQPEQRQEVVALWLDHGRTPADAAYQYIVVPGLDRAEVEGYRRQRGVRTLANATALQAVTHEGLGLTQAVFYRPGELRIAEGLTLTLEQPGLVMVHHEAGRVSRVTVADPNRALDTLELRLSGRLAGAGRGWAATYDEAAGATRLRVELPDGPYAGQSVVMDLGTAAPAAGVIHRVGDRAEGGIVFWTDGSGRAGLVAATADQAESVPWARGRAAREYVHANADGFGAGDGNTVRMVHAATAEEPEPTAASVCAAYRGGGHSDWYLPSKMELDRLFAERDGVGGFARDTYWSSSEYGVGFAWIQFFHGYGGQYTNGKTGAGRVRCVRSF